jgi:iron complex transport system substrate-binding protein
LIEIFRIQTRLRGSVATLVIALGLALPAASAEAPQRIVSLDLCSDWMLLTYARREQLRALSPYLYQFDNDWVEPGLAVHDGSLEQVLALKPDL